MELGLPAKTRTWVTVTDDAIDNKVKQALREGYQCKNLDDVGESFNFDGGDETQYDLSLSDEEQKANSTQSTLPSNNCQLTATAASDSEEKQTLTSSTSTEIVLDERPAHPSFRQDLLSLPSTSYQLSNNFVLNSTTNQQQIIPSQERSQALLMNQALLQHSPLMLQDPQLRSQIQQSREVTFAGNEYLGSLSLSHQSNNISQATNFSLSNIQQQVLSLAAFQRRNELDRMIQQVILTQNQSNVSTLLQQQQPNIGLVRSESLLPSRTLSIQNNLLRDAVTFDGSFQSNSGTSMSVPGDVNDSNNQRQQRGSTLFPEQFSNRNFHHAEATSIQSSVASHPQQQTTIDDSHRNDQDERKRKRPPNS